MRINPRDECKRSFTALTFLSFCYEQASWDEPTQTLVLHHGAEPTYLQSLTLQLSDKVGMVLWRRGVRHLIN